MSDRELRTDPQQVFSGLRILDLSRWIWGEFATKLFADFGAEVIKVEKPGTGSLTRHWSVTGDVDPDIERSPLFLHLNTNKRSVALNLRAATDRRVLLQLVADCDAVVESFAPGKLEQLGLGEDVLRAVNPELVLTRVSSFGQTGPYRERAATGLTVYAMAGPMNATGALGRPPMRKPGNLSHYTIGRAAAEATLAGLIAIQRDGGATTLDVSAHEVLLTSADRRAAYLLCGAYSGVNAPRGVRSAHRGMAKFTGPIPAKDGYAMVYVTNQTFLNRLTALVAESDPAIARFADKELTPETFPQYAEHVHAWLVTRSKIDAMEAAERAGIPLTAYLDLLEVMHHPHFVDRGVFAKATHPRAGDLQYLKAPWRMAGGHQLRRTAPLLDEDGVQVRATGWLGARSRPAIGWPDSAPRQPVGEARRLPLRGIRVVDLTVVWSGPGGTMLLGDLGAEVIRLESNNRMRRNDSAKWTKEYFTDTGYRSAAFPDCEPQPRPYDRSAIFNWHARNKLAACANLETPEGHDAIMRLLEVSDVLVENNSAPTLGKLGLLSEELLARFPRLIVARMPPMGLDGPMADYLGYGPNFNAVVGIGGLEGYEGETPESAGDNYHMDEASPWGIASAVLTALWQRERTGVGGLVELAQSENLMNDLGEYFIDAQWRGGQPPVMGNSDPVLLQDVFGCAQPNTWVAVAVRDDRDWSALIRVLGDRGLATLGRTAPLRRANSATIRACIAEWVATRAVAYVVDALLAAGVPVAKVTSELEVLSDPHLAARDWFQTRHHPAVGTYRYPGLPWRTDGFELVYGRPFPAFGEDNDYVYRDLLDYADERYASERARGLITDEQFA